MSARAYVSMDGSLGMMILVAVVASHSAEAGAGRALRSEATVSAPVGEVWSVWATSAGSQTFFAPKANIQLYIGGPYEIFFNPADERLSTKGCKVLSFSPGEMVSFQWSLPDDLFPELPKGATWVVVEMRAEGTNRTRVTITHLGWGEGPVWDRAYTHMQRGWADLTQRLERRFADGPIDWQSQPMMWKERAGTR